MGDSSKHVINSGMEIQTTELHDYDRTLEVKAEAHCCCGRRFVFLTLIQKPELLGLNDESPYMALFQATIMKLYEIHILQVEKDDKTE